jgi:hypothetical protein
MKIDSIEYGMYTFGPMIGQRCLEVAFKEGESTDLYAEFKTALINSGHEEQFFDAINGSQSTFISFVGGLIEKGENAEEWGTFVQSISQQSLQLQKHPESLKTNMGQLRPPYFIFIGRPKVFTGSRDFYQNFNVVVAIIDNAEYSQMALQEMLNHQFSVVVVPIDAMHKAPSLISSAKKKTVVIDGSGGQLVDYCLENSYRYYADARDTPRSLNRVWQHTE